MNSYAREVIDGLMLAGAWVEKPNRGGSCRLRLSRNKRNALWLPTAAQALHQARVPVKLRPDVVYTSTLVELAEIRRRWYPDSTRAIPTDLRPTPRILSFWWMGAGDVINGGYTLRFRMRGAAMSSVEQFVQRLGSEYRWLPVVVDDRGPIVRLPRSGDRLAFRQLVTPFLPEWASHRLAVRASAPTSARQAARRRSLTTVSEEVVLAIRLRAAAEEPYVLLAQEYDLSEQQVSRIARGVQRAGGPGVAVAPRRARRKIPTKVG